MHAVWRQDFTGLFTRIFICFLLVDFLEAGRRRDSDKFRKTRRDTRDERPVLEAGGSPSHKDGDGSVQMTAGEILTITCTASYGIKWLIPNNTIYMDYDNPLQNGRLDITTDSSNSNLFKITLKLKSLKYTDTGFYSCVSAAPGDASNYLSLERDPKPPLRASRLYVFVKDDVPEHLFLHWADEVKDDDYLGHFVYVFLHIDQYIPCLVTQADAAVTVDINVNELKDQQFSYDPRLGFMIPSGVLKTVPSGAHAKGICHATASSEKSKDAKRSDDAQFQFFSVEVSTDVKIPTILASEYYPYLGMRGFSVSCHYPNDATNINCSWHFPSQSELNTPNARMRVLGKTASNKTLTFDRMTLDDTGKYVCKCHIIGDTQHSESSIDFEVTSTRGRVLEMGFDNNLTTFDKRYGESLLLKVHYRAVPASEVVKSWFHQYRAAGSTGQVNETLQVPNVVRQKFRALDPSVDRQAPTYSAEWTIKNLNVNHTGDYVFRLNVANDVSREVRARVNVNSPASIKSFYVSKANSSLPSNPDFLELDANYDLRCQVEGYPPPEVKLLWSSNCIGKPAGQCEWTAVQEFEGNSYRVSYNYGDFDAQVIAMTRARTTGTYRCTAGQVEQKIDYIVNDIPHAEEKAGVHADLLVERSDSPHNLTLPIYEGDRVEARCLAQKYIYDEPQWIGQDHPIIQYDTTTSPYSNRLFMVFPSIQLNDAGTYECQVPLKTDRAKKVKASVEIVVVKTDKPTFGNDSSPLKFSANYSSPVELRCDAYGVPPPNITWYHNGQVMDLQHRRAGISIENHGRKLKITRAVREDAGTYTCRALNKAGVNTRNFTLVIEGGGSDSSLSKKSIAILASCFSLLVALVLVLLCFVIVLKHRERKRVRLLSELYRQLMSTTGYEPKLDPTRPVNHQTENLPYDPRYEIPVDHLTVGQLLDEGQFGKVYYGTIEPPGKRIKPVTVAVKTPKVGMDVEHQRALLSELKMMIYIGRNVNVLQLVGAITKRMVDGQLYVVVDFCGLGALGTYLKKRRSTFVDEILPWEAASAAQPLPSANDYVLPNSAMTTDARRTRYKSSVDPEWARNISSNRLTKPFVCTSDLLSYSFQIANGMDYLASKNLIHRDLAVRNVLLTNDHRIKISDFGLARHDDLYRIRKLDVPLPIKWMALESIVDREYTVQSDVWSFGIVLWEIFSLGETPYAGRQVDSEFISWLKQGNRMDPPDSAPDEIYHLMCQCWLMPPTDRPSFADCREKLGKELSVCNRLMYETVLADLASFNMDDDEGDGFTGGTGYPFRTVAPGNRISAAGDSRRKSEEADSLRRQAVQNNYYNTSTLPVDDQALELRPKKGFTQKVNIV